MYGAYNEFDKWDRDNQRDMNRAADTARSLDEQDFRNFTHQLIAEFESGESDCLMRIVRQFLQAANEGGDTPMGDWEDLENLADVLTGEIIVMNDGAHYGP